MRPLTSLITLLSFIGISLYCQQNIQSSSIDHKTNKGLFDLKKEKKRYDQPDKAAAWLASMRKTPEDTNPSQLNLAYQNDLKTSKAFKTNQDLPALQFEELGPGIFGGRIRGFVIHPEREGHLLAGGVSGGVWKSTDDGQSWQAKSDFLPSIAIGSMLIDPDNPERVFVGTGEGFFNFDSAQGNGIFVSEDFGETWQHLDSTTNSNFYYVNRMARIPNSQVLLAATARGIFRSSNLGQSWSKVSQNAISGRGFVDLQLDPSDSNHLLAYHFGNSNDVLKVDVTSPNNLPGSNLAVPAAFGPAFTENGITGTLAPASYNNGSNFNGCQTITSDVSNKIAVMQRGTCDFTLKVKNAQNAGAKAALIVQSGSGAAETMGGTDDTINIPSAMVEFQFGNAILQSESNLQAKVSKTTSDNLTRFVMRSTDQGLNWQVLDGSDGLPTVGVERMEIGFANNGKTYIAVSKEAEDIGDNQTNGTLGLWQSIDVNNKTFAKTSSNTNFIERQGWYDLAIAVNPSDSNHVLMGAIDLYATTNGGSSIKRKSYWSPFNEFQGFVSKYIHADHHGYFFSPHNNNHIYVVSDGGVSKSTDGGETWSSLNNGLNISQTYGIAVSPEGDKITSGTQDNGSHLYFGDKQSWLEWQGGDGGYSAWDQQQGRFVYGSYVNGQMYGSNNSGLSAQAIELPDTEGARFIQPFVLDENNGNRMLVGTDNVFYTTSARALSNANWEDVSGTINGTGISAVAFNPHSTSLAYAGMSGSSTSGDNQIIKITGLGTTNQVSDIGPSSALGVARSVVTDIKVDRFDTSGQTLYATFGDYKSNRILKSNNGGSTWTSISGNLPQIPLYQVVNDPKDAETLYVGSELGLWIGKQSGNSYNWSQFDYGPAFTRVIDLVWNNGDLYVGTHGRGTYKASKNPFQLSLIKFVATNSSCDVDNYLDRGESGKLMIQVKNNSGKDFNNININFNESNFIDFTDANQTFSLNGFSTTTLALNTSLDSKANCLADINIPVTIDTGSGVFDSSISLTSAVNQTAVNGTFFDGAEDDTSAMKSVLALGSDDWIQVSDNAYSGNNSWFTTNENAFSDKSLVSPWMTFDAGGNVLKFALSYDIEGDSNQYWDGMVLEMRLKDSDNWFDIGHLSSVAYDGQLNTNNTAQAQFAWSGTKLPWRKATVNLGTQYVGQTAQIRFRMVSDTNSNQEGVWIDDISLSHVYTLSEMSCDSCISSNNTQPNKGMWFDPAYPGHGFIIEAFGANNLFYTMFYTYDDEGNPEWFNSLTTLSNGVLNAAFEPNTLQKFTYDYNIDSSAADPVSPDPTITDGRLSIDFNAETVINHAACQDGVYRPPNNVALVTWKINNITREWCIIPLLSDKARPDPDFGTAWWAGPSENGWGYSLAQTGDVLIAYIFYYDADGNPRWATGSNSGFSPNTSFNVPMLDVFGYGRTAPPIERTLLNSGNIQFKLSNTLRDLDTDGLNSVDITYQGDEGGRWLRENIKIMNLLQPH